MANKSTRRSRLLPAATKSTNAAYPRATTPSTRKKTANTHIASTTSTGARTPKRSHSTYTALSMFPNRKPRKIHWRRRVRTIIVLYESIALTVIVRSMSELVAQVHDEQNYIILRERVHRNTAESTNARIKWWSVFQLMVLIGQGFFQVWWLKRFFEVNGAITVPAAFQYRPTNSPCRSNALYSSPSASVPPHLHATARALYS